MKKSAPCLSVVCLLAVSSALLSDEPRPPADIFATSFEEEQGYRVGWVQDQNGWGIDRTVKNPNEVDVITGGVMDMPVPDGSQMLKSAAFPASANLVFAKTPIEDFLAFSALFAYEPLDPAKITSKFFLANESGKFYGVCFGIKLHEGKPAFFCMDREEELIIAPGIKPEPSVFYRFECDVDIGAQSFVVRVYDHEKNALLGDATANFRSEVRKFNNLLLGLSPTAYVDDIWISSKAK